MLCGGFIERLSPNMASNPSHVGSSTTVSSVSTVSAVIQPGKAINSVSAAIQPGKSINSVSAAIQPGKAINSVSAAIQPGKAINSVSAVIQPGKAINSVKTVFASGVVKTVGGEVGKSSAGIYTVNNFIFTWRMDTVNLCQLVAYVTQSGLARKVMGFVEKQAAVTTASCMGLYFVGLSGLA